MNFLSKTDFQVARSCPTKLFYQKNCYPSTLDEDEYLRFLADGGYMVQAIAQLLHPGGIEISMEGGVDAAAARTADALRAETVTLFEATFVSGAKMARVDILRKLRGHIELIEVKAKSVDSSQPGDAFRGSRGRIRPEWKPYLEDVAYQTHILTELFPGVAIEPALCLVDQAKSTNIDTIFRCFELTRDPQPNGAPQGRPTVRFTGDAEALRQDHFLTTISVRAEVDEMLPEIAADAERFAASVTASTKLPANIGVHCRSCDYRLAKDADRTDPRNGYRECWGALADESPHLLEYYCASGIGGRATPLINDLVGRGRANLADVEESDLVKSNGEVGPTARRQQIQREYTLRNEEFFGPALGSTVRGHAFPLHFLDFETSRIAVPYHAGMRPYSQVCFQWSCHTLHHPEGTFEHHDWINTRDVYPNIEFARSLMSHLGTSGTIYTWSAHERSALADIVRQMHEYGTRDGALRDWLTATVAGNGMDIVDLCAVAKTDYFHPQMRGRLSIKYVLPAIWGQNTALHRHPEFARYLRRDVDGNVINPYLTLPALPCGSAENAADEVITDGVAAMRAYQELLYGASRSDRAKKEQWTQLLRQYCRLDTCAMAIIWTHWMQNTRGGNRSL